jgi:hypothetical protein
LKLFLIMILFYLDFKLTKFPKNTTNQIKIKFKVMLTLKSQLTCSYCSRIFKDPILLPCDDSVCREHLSERDVVKENRIKCKECQQEFQLNDDEFRSNKGLRMLVESQSYLSEEDMRLKKKWNSQFESFFNSTTISFN